MTPNEYYARLREVLSWYDTNARLADAFRRLGASMIAYGRAVRGAVNE